MSGDCPTESRQHARVGHSFRSACTRPMSPSLVASIICSANARRCRVCSSRSTFSGSAALGAAATVGCVGGAGAAGATGCGVPVRRPRLGEAGAAILGELGLELLWARLAADERARFLAMRGDDGGEEAPEGWGGIDDRRRRRRGEKRKPSWRLPLPFVRGRARPENNEGQCHPLPVSVCLCFDCKCLTTKK
jgi:hypothetical protein